MTKRNIIRRIDIDCNGECLFFFDGLEKGAYDLEFTFGSLTRTMLESIGCLISLWNEAQQHLEQLEAQEGK